MYVGCSALMPVLKLNDRATQPLWQTRLAAIAGQVTEFADGLPGNEAGAQQPMTEQIRQPFCILHVGLCAPGTARHDTTESISRISCVNCSAEGFGDCKVLCPIVRKINPVPRHK